MNSVAPEPAVASRALVAANLQLARALLKLSQEELGARCELYRSHISAIERQELNVGIDTIERIADGLKIPAYILFMPRHDAQIALSEAFKASREAAL